MGTKLTKHLNELVGKKLEKRTKMGTNFEVHTVWILTRHIARISRNQVHTFWGILHVYHWDKLYLEIINCISMHSVHTFWGILHIYRWDNLYLEIINLMYLSFSRNKIYSLKEVFALWVFPWKFAKNMMLEIFLVCDYE